MDKKTKDELTGTIRRLVWAGFDDPDAIEIILTEEHKPGEIDPGSLRAQIDREWELKEAEELDWPDETDCDRLNQVFDSLEREGILVLQNAGLTKSDGLEDVEDEYDDAGGERSGIVGYCFYHGQDLARVMQHGELYLAYGAIDGDDEKGVGIGRRIRTALEAAGFTVEWDGSIGTRLLVRGIKWQRRLSW